MISSEAFWDNAAEKYAKSTIKDMESYDQTISRVRACLAPDQKVIELGCGTGSTALLLADAVGHLTATDISSRMIGIARDKAAAQGVGNVTFRQGDLSDDSGAGPFDVVMGFNLLHLIEDLPGALSAIHAMLKPGGLFISKSACLGENGWYMRVLVALMQRLGKAPFAALLKIRELDDQVALAGFKIIEANTFPGMVAKRFIVAQKL